jgi:hypothetical protein
MAQVKYNASRLNFNNYRHTYQYNNNNNYYYLFICLRTYWLSGPNVNYKVSMSKVRYKTHKYIHKKDKTTCMT